MEENEGLYELLGLPPDGAQVSDVDLRRAYRRKALACHPDKRPNDAAAAAEFARLQRVYEIMSDEAGRKAYDELLRVRKERAEKQSQMSAKRRKMVEDLKQKEAAFEVQRKQKAAEDNAAKRLKEELARIRAKNSQKNAASGVNKSTSDAPSAGSYSFLSEQDRDKTLKVRWDSTSKPGYDSQSLREIFERLGRVEDVLILQKESAKESTRKTALVVMETSDAAHAATQAQCGELSNPLLVLPVGLPAKAAAQQDSQRQPEKKPPPSSPPPPAANAATVSLAGAGFHSQEDLIMQKLRKAQEEKKRKTNS